MPRLFSAGKDSLFNKWDQENQILTFKRMKLVPYLILYTKVNSKQTKGQNIKTKIMKVLEENIGQKFTTLDLAVICWV